MSNHPKPIFFDHSGKRWKKVTRFALAAALVISIAGAILCISILALPVSPLSLSTQSYIHGLIPRLDNREEAASRFRQQKERRLLAAEIDKEQALHRSKLHGRASDKPYSTTIGFYVGWNDASYQSLRRHVDSLTYIMPEWLTLNADGKTFNDQLYRQDKSGKKVEGLSKRHNVPIVVVLTNAEHGSFDWPRLRSLLQLANNDQNDDVKSLAQDVRDVIKDHHWAGVNLDFEPPSSDELTPADRQLVHDAFPKLIKIFRSAFNEKINPKKHAQIAARKLILTQDLPPPEANAKDSMFSYAKLNDVNDFVVVMLYDQHSDDSAAGPIAGANWLDSEAEKIFQQMDSSKVVIGIGNYCYDWPVRLDKNGDIVANADGDISTIGRGMVTPLSTALSIADNVGSPLRMDEEDLNPYFTYADANKKDHVVYILDAITAHNAIQSLRGYGPRGVALWKLGDEDPTLWSFFNENALGKPADLSALSRVVYKSQVALDEKSQGNQGKGEIFAVVSKPKPGKRDLTINNDGIITSETFTQFPSSYVLSKLGADHSKELALTFDDGPDPVFTPQILDVLREKKANGTFFVIGQNMDQYPGIVQREWAEGNEIGNHTFTHPHFPEISRFQAQLQLNTTQRGIESLTGHSTRLFRPPYGEGSDSNLSTADVSVIQEGQDLGYYTVGMNIDPSDYERPGVDNIVQRVVDQVDKGWGNVILLHDGGGQDRSQTVRALPTIIDKLRKQGYKFVTVSYLMGGARERDAIFPRITGSAEAINGLDQLIFEAGFDARRLLQIIFFLSITLGLLRIVITTPLAIIQKRRLRGLCGEDYTPPVTVIIPSYNEGKVVCRTIRTVLNSDYPDLKVIVVDDGSTDNTADAVKAEFANESRLLYIHKENGGKASALNVGIEEAGTEVLVCLDADTVFARDTIVRLARHFSDPNVGAVAGNVKVGNRSNPLTVWQSIEYITSQNFDRRAYAMLGSVPVVPGAVGAWRKSAILRAGGYESNTLAEDTDLTFKIQVLGYEIRTENDAFAYTEVPDGVGALAKQRFRWAFGILQSLWKHRKKLFHREYGAFSMLVMPAMWVYNIFFQAFSPVVDLMIILALLSGGLNQVLTYYAVFFVLDLFSAIIAFRLDRENPKQIAWLFWQRFFYRQFMYYVIIKSIFAALKGHQVGWGKLQRKATATLPSS